MPKRKEPILLSWSGGKDSAMTLWQLRKSPDYVVTHLVTVLTEQDERITMHGVPRHLVEAQAEALGLPLTVVHVPQGAPNGLYCERIDATLVAFKEAGLTKIAFGDLFLDDLRDFREEHLERLGMEALFPLWHRETKELAYAFLNARFKAVVTCVDERALNPDCAGRHYDKSFIADLPLNVDPCGENGEFHTFVFDGPLFSKPISIKACSRRTEDKFHYCDLARRATPA